MSQFWVEWDLPADRDVATFWRHSVGERATYTAMNHRVEVSSSFASKRTCLHSNYGIQHGYDFGGGFPATYSTDGSILSQDVCMVVAVMSVGSSGDGFTHNTPVFDAPTSNTDWPNVSDRDKPPFLSVWLR